MTYFPKPHAKKKRVWQTTFQQHPTKAHSALAPRTHAAPREKPKARVPTRVSLSPLTRA